MMNHAVRFTVEKIEKRLDLIKGFIYRRKHALGTFRYHELPNAETQPDLNADDRAWQVVAPHSYWGHIQRNFVMRTTFRVPKDFGERVALYLPMGDSGDFAHPEAVLYADGVAFGTVDRFHQEILIPQIYHDDAEHTLFLHGWTGFWNAQGEHAQLFMRECFVVEIDQPMRDLWVMANTAWRIQQRLAEHDSTKHDILTALDRAFKVLDTREPLADYIYREVAEAQRVLEEGLRHAGKALDVTVHSVGHAHIDVAWLWTLGQTRRKAARTFYTVDHLMSQFPDYKFTQSQPQLYDYIRQDYPELFERIRARVAEGRWELIGGMWIEADCNISGAESLARQFLLGRQFFREHFGDNSDSSVLWLPDVFGYSAQLPQLIRLAGLEYFFTIKIGWSQYNKLPYDSFWWQGLDGTKVLTHFSTTPESDTHDYPSTYNAPALPESPLVTWRRFKQKEHQRDLLMVYGWGDGGGGPTRDMLENIQALHDFPSSPHTRFSKAVDFFRTMEQNAGEKLPTWNGELYLEYHRGTYTTQARNKRANRKSEVLLHDAEFLATYASLLDPHFVYPHQALHKAWELVCLNQFHDIIPGSSIAEVYVESLQQYAEVERLANDTIEQALTVIRAHVSGETIAINGAPVANRTAYGHPMPPYSVVGYPARERNTSAVVVAPHLLEDAHLLVQVNNDGDIVRIFDKAHQREVLPKGTLANQFQAFEDRPINWDAWDIDIFYQDRQWLAEPATSIEPIIHDNQPALKITRRILHSTYTQVLTLHGGLLQFDTEIDWQETHVLLKVAFPVDVLTPKATYHIQWGHVERPTHWNTSWDWAKFETVGHHWADLSEENYGVSLLNDCKYGHDIRDNVMRLTLLKSPTFPDPNADKGQHRFTYAIYPHREQWLAETIANGYRLNNPVRYAEGTLNDQSTVLPALVSADHALIETIKRAEDGDGVIIRLYEPYRRRGWVSLQTAFPLASVQRCNLLEDTLEDLPIPANAQEFRLYLTPFQIVTLRLRFVN